MERYSWLEQHTELPSSALCKVHTILLNCCNRKHILHYFKKGYLELASTSHRQEVSQCVDYGKQLSVRGQVVIGAEVVKEV